MFGRHGWLVLWVVCLSCHAVLAVEPAVETPSRQAWQKGQEAMRLKQLDQAIGFYQQSLAADPSFSRNHMSLAAAHLEKGDEATACVHLGKYVAAHPEHLIIRCHYAELLLRLQHRQEARREFERFIVDAQEQGEAEVEHLVHSHSRLMEIAEQQEDEYAECLHRGIGLLLLAQGRAALGDPHGELPAEGLLCKAAAELAQARRLRPAEARPCWYLHRVWSLLDQEQSAARWLHAAREAAPFSYLTPAEQRSLQLTLRCRDAKLDWR
jgi:tetratricopeptide (TPR) repeat protein